MKYIISAWIILGLFVLACGLYGGLEMADAVFYAIVFWLSAPLFVLALAGAVTVVSGFQWTEEKRKAKYNVK